MHGDLKRTTLITKTASFIALITVGSWLSIPFVPVPITLQTLFVLLAGACMKRFGSLPVLLYIFLGILNMPVFHNGLGGFPILLGPTGGYLIGFIPAATIVGFSYEKSSKVVRIIGIIAATMIIYMMGVGWLTYSTGIPFAEAIVVGFLLFIPGDILKGTIAYVTAQRLT